MWVSGGAGGGEKKMDEVGNRWSAERGIPTNIGIARGTLVAVSGGGGHLGCSKVFFFSLFQPLPWRTNTIEVDTLVI